MVRVRKVISRAYCEHARRTMPLNEATLVLRISGHSKNGLDNFRCQVEVEFRDIPVKFLTKKDRTLKSYAFEGRRCDPGKHRGRPSPELYPNKAERSSLNIKVVKGLVKKTIMLIEKSMAMPARINVNGIPMGTLGLKKIEEEVLEILEADDNLDFVDMSETLGTTIGGLDLASLITDLCVTYGVQEYLTGTKVPPQRKIGYGEPP
uniref:Uncharacterized protein n=1 Tax=Cannabis sativa TaxID=3483 RepID=A0A803Q451_CANSA